MAKYLIILESPGKIDKFLHCLPKDYEVIASCGHVFDLPEKKLSVDIKKGFEPTFEVLPGKEDIVEKIKKSAKGKDIVYLMTDRDVEGHGIAFNIYRFILKDHKNVRRATTIAINKKDILEGIESSININDTIDAVDAYETRRILDRLCGYRTSFITQQSTGGKSAGRVQSAGLRVLAEREKEIKNFVPIIYWPVEIELLTKKKEKIVALIKEPKALDISTEAEAIKIISVFKSKPVKVSKYEVKNVNISPYPPFTTSTLQQAASSILGFSPDRTMKAAQKLYESGACVLEDEIVVFDNGKIIEIKDAKKDIKNNVKGFPKFFGFDKKINLKVGDVKLKGFQKFDYNDFIYDIRTMDGQEISTTFDHKLLCFDEDNISWKEAKDIKENDFLLCAKNIPVNRTKNPLTIFDFIEKFDVSILDKILIKLKNKDLGQKLIFENMYSVSQSTYHKYRRNNKIPILWFVKHLRQSDKKEELINEIEYYQWARAGSKPEMFSVKSFCYFLGLCLGDGHISKKGVCFPICITSEVLWNELHKKMNSIKNGRFQKCKSKKPEKSSIIFSGQILKNLCIHYGGYEGKKFHRIFIHPFMSELHNDLLLEYVAGLFDSDGCIKPVKNRINVSYTSKSQKMAKQLNVLFRTMGYASGIHRRNNDRLNCNIKILENSHQKFINDILEHLFVKKEFVKNNIVGMLKDNSIQNFNFPLIKYIEKIREEKGFTKLDMSLSIFNDRSSYWNYLRLLKGHTRSSYITPDILIKIAKFLNDKLLLNIAKGDVYFAQIKKIDKRKYAGKVYDITTSSDNFICNTFYSHNCTYHRTDSLNIVPEFISTIRTHIGNNFSIDYLPSSAIFYKTKSKNAQEAHEAIRPTDIATTSCNSLGQDEKKLYELIWKRTVASQMTPAIYERRSAEFTCEKYVLSATGSKEIFDGFRKVWNYGSSEDKYLPDLKIGEIVDVIDARTEEKKTQPPSHYSEASFIKELEKLGIGRPSTYATIPKTLEARKYISLEKKNIVVTDLGINVSDFLIAANFCFIDINFTSQLEDKLDDIANGKLSKLATLKEFWDRLKHDIDNAKGVKTKLSETGLKCPKCKAPLLKKHSKWGDFYGCSNYGNKETPCDYTAKIGEHGEIVEKVVKEKNYSNFKCDNCGKKLLIRVSKKGNEILGCEDFAKDKKCSGFYDVKTGEKIVFKKKKFFKKFGSGKKKNDAESDEN